jgi:hypothetical protein
MNLFRHATLAAALAATVAPTIAADFAFAITPPRFELSAKPGERLRQVIEITNAAPEQSALSIRTAEWNFAPDGTSEFSDELRPGSCRPWVAIERRDLVVGARQAYRFRFEVAPPATQAPVECRFAILLQGKEAVASQSGGPSVTGRVAVIVYVAVGDVQPDLEVVGAALSTRDGKPVPVLQVRNKGTAHGRLDGFLKLTDAAGRTFDVTPANTPVLPGETRAVAVTLNEAAPGAAAPQFPATLRGKLEWGKGRSTDVDRRIDR